MRTFLLTELGMFLYAKIVLDSVEDEGLDDIKNDLSVLPETLDDA
jgi:hypothetical protein